VPQAGKLCWHQIMSQRLWALGRRLRLICAHGLAWMCPAPCAVEEPRYRTEAGVVVLTAGHKPGYIDGGGSPVALSLAFILSTASRS
jgi:hypothetical protein